MDQTFSQQLIDKHKTQIKSYKKKTFTASKTSQVKVLENISGQHISTVLSKQCPAISSSNTHVTILFSH